MFYTKCALVALYYKWNLYEEKHSEYSDRAPHITSQLDDSIPARL